MKKFFLFVTMTLCIAAVLLACGKKNSTVEETVANKIIEEASNFQGGKPWENGGKPIEEYTWEEFLELNGDLQEAFYEAFPSSEDFDKWLSRVNPEENLYVETIVIEKPWENGGKAVEAYTWEEFQGLSGELQEAFFEAFATVEAFKEWQNRVNPEGTVPVEERVLEDRPWESGGKPVEKYTWKEFLGLSGDLQEAFFEAFASAEEFDAWRNRVNPEKTEKGEEKNLEDRPWENGGKAPEDYTWEEFENLSSEQQEAFFEAFESAEVFEAWMEKSTSTD